MEKKYFTNEQLINMEKLHPACGTSMSGSNLYIMENENNKKFVIKEFKQDINLKNKLHTINLLKQYKEIIKIDGLVIPDLLAINPNDQLIGPITPYIDSFNLKSLYKLENYPIKKIINYLYQIGEMFDRIKKINEQKLIRNFALSDVHEANFIIDKKTDKVKFLDIETCRIEDNLPSMSKYLTRYSVIARSSEKIPKYYFNSVKPQYLEPTINTDLYCYIMMILNYLYKGNVENMEVNQFYNYLEYLKDIGLSIELIDIFSKVYTNDDNINPVYLLDTIPNDISEASYDVYREKIKK